MLAGCRSPEAITASWIAAINGLAAGMVNLSLALLMGASWPPLPHLAGAMLVGWLAYGVSLTLFVVALRHLGTARTGAYFSVAPFIGAAMAVPLLGESVGPRPSIAGCWRAHGIRSMAAPDRAPPPRTHA